MDKKLEMLCDKLKDELGMYGEKPLSPGNLDAIYKLTTSAEKLCKMKKMDEESEYSQAYSHRGGMWDARGSYDSGNSYNNYRMSSDYPMDSDYSGMHYVRGHYSREDGNARMSEQLERMMYEAKTDREKEAIRKALEMIK